MHANSGITTGLPLEQETDKWSEICLILCFRRKLIQVRFLKNHVAPRKNFILKIYMTLINHVM